MTILTLVCSQSTADDADNINFTNRFTVRLPHAIPVKGVCQLVEYMCIKQTDSSDSFHKLLAIDIPWLQSASAHIVGGSSNEAASSKIDGDPDVAILAYDKSRHLNRDLILCTPLPTTHVSPNDMVFSMNTTTIPQQFDIVIKSAINGSDYTNVMELILKFSITPAALF